MFPSVTSEDYIIPVPSALNCSGTVSAIRYCYTGDSIGTEQSVFTLLTLQQNNLDFNITDVIPVMSTPTNEICTERSYFWRKRQFCCDTLPLEMMDRFSLPVQFFAFGVIPTNNLLMYSIIFPSFRVEHYRYAHSVIGTPTTGNTIPLNTRGSDRALFLLQFFISKL